MPIYEYACTQCGHELEAIQKLSDTPLVFCPECNSESLKKKISAAAFKLTGTGWYETDFKDSNKKSETKASSETDNNKVTKTDKKDSTSTKSKVSDKAKNGGSKKTASA